jgi:hypothetical protein
LNRTRVLCALLAAAGMAIWSSGLAANTVAGEIVTGNLTAVDGRRSLNIQGRTYRLKEGSPAAAAAAHLAPGQSVSVQLDGPANSSYSQVINVVTHTGR